MSKIGQLYYYYIPSEHEAVVKQYQDIWLQDPNAYTIMSAFYEYTSVEEEEETVYSTILDQTKNLIPLSYTVFIGEWEKATLYAFILQGIMPTALEAIALSLEGVKKFGNFKELLEYEQTLR